MTITVGLDVGGAHFKIARFEDGTPVAVNQYLCALWKGLENLDNAIAAAKPLLDGAQRIAVTMTGELSDLFDSREEGVTTLVDLLCSRLDGRIDFYLGQRGFGSAEVAKAHPADAGSMNFFSTAQAVGRIIPQALLIDFGSTTVDVIAVSDGEPVARGLNDTERQANGELVYTGLTRTAVMGVAQSAPLKGRYVGLAREYLATMADVRRVLGVDLCEIDLHDTADGRGKSLRESTVRLARMFGCDAEQASQGDWRTAAAFIREAQLRSVTEGAYQVLSAHDLELSAPVIAAGIGAVEAIEVGRRLGFTGITFGAVMGLSGDLDIAATHHAPAVAVGRLLNDQGAA